MKPSALVWFLWAFMAFCPAYSSAQDVPVMPENQDIAGEPGSQETAAVESQDVPAAPESQETAVEPGSQEIPVEPEIKDYIQQADGFGMVNWESGLVTASGIGSAPDGSSFGAQGKTVAVRMATVNARRNLLAVLQAVRVDSLATVKDFMAADSTAATKIIGLVQNSVIATVHREDGSVEATASVALRGELAETLLPQKIFISHMPAIPALAPEEGPTAPELAQPGNATATVETPVLAEPEGDYSGAIIDGRGLGASPALSPRLLDENGLELYGPALVDRESALSSGLAGYVRDLEAAGENKRVSGNPVLFLARKTAGQGGVDLVLDATEAGRFRRMAGQEFVKQCRLLIILD